MEAKRWGPFTGRQLMIMFVVLVVGAVTVPIAANATSTGQDVVITDPTASPERYAKVDTSGFLAVKDNHLKVDAFGSLKVAPQYGEVTVDGVTRPAAPTELYTRAATTTTNCLSFAPPPGQALVITSLWITVGNLPTDWTVHRATGTSCNTFSGLQLKAHPAFVSEKTTIVPFPSGLVLAPGDVLIMLLGNGTFGVEAGVNGYLRPSTDCPTAADCRKGD
jgi:hypothetical protein